MKKLTLLLGVVALLLAGYVATLQADASSAGAQVFELRTYYAAPGKLDALNARFRDHTCKLFEKHGMKNVGYWVPQEQTPGEEKLIYILAHKSREAAAASWKAFQADPDWHAARDASEKEGKLLAKRPDVVFMNAVDYSPIK